MVATNFGHVESFDKQMYIKFAMFEDAIVDVYDLEGKKYDTVRGLSKLDDALKAIGQGRGVLEGIQNILMKKYGLTKSDVENVKASLNLSGGDIVARNHLLKNCGIFSEKAFNAADELRRIGNDAHHKDNPGERNRFAGIIAFPENSNSTALLPYDASVRIITREAENIYKAAYDLSVCLVSETSRKVATGSVSNAGMPSNASYGVFVVPPNYCPLSPLEMVDLGHSNPDECVKIIRNIRKQYSQHAVDFLFAQMKIANPRKYAKLSWQIKIQEKSESYWKFQKNCAVFGMVLAVFIMLFSIVAGILLLSEAAAIVVILLALLLGGMGLLIFVNLCKWNYRIKKFLPIRNN